MLMLRDIIFGFLACSGFLFYCLTIYLVWVTYKNGKEILEIDEQKKNRKKFYDDLYKELNNRH